MASFPQATPFLVPWAIPAFLANCLILVVSPPRVEKIRSCCRASASTRHATSLRLDPLWI